MSAEEIPETTQVEEPDLPVDDTDPAGADPVEPDEEEATDNIRHLLPVHAAPNTGHRTLTVKREKGRPRKVERMPTTSDLEYHARMSEENAKFIDNDPVVAATRGRADTLEILRTIRAEIAAETAALHFQRVENEKFGRDTAQVSSRRIEALNKIASIEFEIKKLGADVIDLRGERFQRVFLFWIESLKEVAKATLSPEQLDMFFNKLETTLDGWEDRASEAMASGK